MLTSGQQSLCKMAAYETSTAGNEVRLNLLRHITTWFTAITWAPRQLSFGGGRFCSDRWIARSGQQFLELIEAG